MPGEDIDEPEVEEYMSAEEGEPPTADPSSGSPEGGAVAPDSVAPDSVCLTIQPNRILCGERTTIYIILRHKVDIQSKTEVEFSSDSAAPQHVPATVLNEYTISVMAPDMPAGPVSLTLVSDQASASVMPVTYYTCMEEVSRHLENATSPVEFICQAFNITSDKTETLDNLLTDLLASNMPVGGLQLFGIKQIEINNMSTYQRKEDLPTLLHFAARYGLKKLTTALLHCPGALQAYSVMNRRGEYPNTVAERCGYTELRQFMDVFVETADMLKSHIQDEDSAGGGVYVAMAARSQDMDRYSGHGEDIYESMLDMLDPECADDLYEVMTGVAGNQNPEETMLRQFFQAKPGAGQSQDAQGQLETMDTKEVVHQNGAEPHEKEEATEDEAEEEEEEEEEEEDEPDLDDTGTDRIYDAVDNLATYPATQSAINRPPAPMPRPENSATLDTNSYITRVFTDRIIPPKTPARLRDDVDSQVAGPTNPTACSSASDTYIGVKTPGQRQLIALQERVKLGVISVDQAVQEFKAWQFDHERRSHSLRYQQENLKRLRNSITRRHKERQTKGKKCGTESNRLSTQSMMSSSSGTEPDFEVS
ncbi:hypothetical protein CRUP_013732 [Coryphaenoides rupestris]|nr:hypothetical protein CRUP_013732 [Coryphaenoides rupestris]